MSFLPASPWRLAALFVLAQATPCVAQDTPATGQILVVTQPSGARVFVDGADVGSSPVSVPGLVPGAHLVVVRGADDGRAERVVVVDVGRSTLVELALPAASPPPPAEAAAPPTVATTPPPPTAVSPAVEPEGTPSPSADATPPPDTARSELPALDLAAPAPPRDEPAETVEDETIAATGFPGLLGMTLGVHIDVPAYVVNPVRAVATPGCPRGCDGSSTIFSGRISLEIGLEPAFALVVAADFVGAFAMGAAANLPGWIPLVRDFAIALQPHLQALVYYHTGGAILLSGEATLRLGIAPIPHLVVAGEIGVVVMGALPFRGSNVTEGAYVGPIFGGGVEWAFY